jgi:hypothetical protein
MKKKLLITFAILLAIPLVLLLLVALMIDSVVRTGTETAASLALKVPAKLEGATIKYAGRATLTRFEIGNPPGYKEPRAAAFEEFDAVLRTSSLFEDVIQVSDVLVAKPDLTIEFIGTKSNWSVLVSNLASVGTGQPSESESGRSDASTGKKFRIERLRVEGATVRFRSDLIPGGSHKLTLAPFELKGIGTTPGGASMAQVLGTLLHALGGEAAKSEENHLPLQLLESFRSEAAGTARKAIDFTQQQLKDAGKALQQDLNELFEPKKK